MKIEITERERDTILAALRNWQETILANHFIPTRLYDIAKNDRVGDDAMLTIDEIDELCERVNK